RRGRGCWSPASASRCGCSRPRPAASTAGAAPTRSGMTPRSAAALAPLRSRRRWAGSAPPAAERVAASRGTLEDFGQLQRLGPLAPVAAPEVLGEALADDRQRDGDVGEAHDVGAPVRLLAPGDALGRERGAAEAAVDRVVRGDLDRSLVGR